MNNTKIIFYSFRRCPYAMRARMALKYADIKLEHREILLKDKPESLLNYSAKGTVPVLVVDNQVLDESLDIMKWALMQQDKDNWLLSDCHKLHHEMDDLILKCDQKFKLQLDLYKYSDRYPLTELEYRNESLWYLKLLDNRLKSHSFLISNQVSLADIAIFPFIRQYAFVDKTWFDNNKFHNLQNWLEKWLKTEMFLSIMQKHTLWGDN